MLVGAQKEVDPKLILPAPQRVEMLRAMVVGVEPQIEPLDGYALYSSQRSLLDNTSLADCRPNVNLVRNVNVRSAAASGYGASGSSVGAAPRQLQGVGSIANQVHRRAPR